MTSRQCRPETTPGGCPANHGCDADVAWVRNRFAVALLATTLPFAALAAPNVITDWDEKGAAIVQGNVPAAPRIGPTGATRIMAVMHIAMFDAVNAVDAKYASYKGDAAKADPGCSQQAAAATAAAKVLIKMHPESATKSPARLGCLSRYDPGWQSQGSRGSSWVKRPLREPLRCASRMATTGCMTIARAPTRCLCPDHADGELGTRHHDAVRADQSISVPPWSAA